MLKLFGRDHAVHVAHNYQCGQEGKYFFSRYIKAVQDYESLEIAMNALRNRRNLQRVMLRALENRRARRKLSLDLDKLIARVLDKLQTTCQQLEALEEEEEFLTLYLCATGSF